MIQQLMNEIYDYWNLPENQHLSKQEIREYARNLSEKHLRAIQIGNMNYQIENGGFMQWYDNGYAKLDLREILKFLSNFSEPTIKNIYNVLLEFEECLDYYETAKQQVEDRLPTYYEDLEECLYNIFSQRTDKLDERYYDENEKFLETIEEIYFNKGE